MTRQAFRGAVLAALTVAMAATPAAAQQSASERLEALFADAWAFTLEESPTFATEVGEERYNHLLPSVSAADEARRAERRRELLERLRGIERSALSPSEQVSYDMFERGLVSSLEGYAHREYLLPLTSEWGFHMSFAQLPGRVPLRDAEDYRDYIARLEAFPAYVAQHIALLREGLRTGMTVPREVMGGYETTIAAHIVADPAESVFYGPFEELPEPIPAAERAALLARGRAAVADAVIPAYRTFHDFMVEEYIPGARETVGASAMPGGRAYYEYLVRDYTTLDISPEEVHALGLREVERIRAEMERVMRDTGFEGDFAAFIEFLRTDDRFYADSPEELLKEAAWIAKRMDGQLPKLFRLLPRQPYGVEPVPADIAPRFTAGRYLSAPPGSTRAGMYWVNTHDLDSRTLYTLEALTLHEAVPGHHLQIALAQELEGLPLFRRYAGISAFSEGWGLYAERLGKEVGFYADPYSDFGRLTYEMWRAARLVIDTGVHAKGWTRQQAIEFLASNTALSLHEVGTEIDRYISWPGQALAYKIGELKIRELRERAEQALGEDFDVRAFHEVVLGNGVVPLSVLERQVDAWIAAERAAA